jgi:hypothetical protein
MRFFPHQVRPMNEFHTGINKHPALLAQGKKKDDNFMNGSSSVTFLSQRKRIITFRLLLLPQNYLTAVE